MVIEVTFDTTDVYISTTVSPVYVNVSFEAPAGGGGAAVWGDITGTLSDQTDLQSALDLKVPYTGATTNVNLGEYEIKAGQLTLDTSPTGTAAVGTTRWNDTTGLTETTLKGGSVILKNGVDLVARVVNKVSPNTTLTKAAYQAVRVSGAQGQRLAVAFAQANNDNNSADTIGLVTETIATNQEGFIITVGQLENINTTGSLQGETWADGDVLYLSPTTAGALTNVKPNATIGHIVVIGYVEYAHANNGKIYVKVMNGWELGELHDVYVPTPSNNDVLTYETSSGLWKNKSVGTSLGYTPANSATTLTINGVTYDLSTSRTYSVGTVTSVAALTIGTSGTDITSSVANGTTTPVITLNIPTASATNRGALSSTDWATFNAKQGALTLTTTGTSGAATLIGTTLNIPQYSGGGGMAIGGSITSATAGSVLFVGSGGVLAQSNANFFWDATNSRLGIGTNAPTYRLDIAAGASGNTGIKVVGLNTNGAVVDFFSTTTQIGSFLATGSSLSFGTYQSSQMSLESYSTGGVALRTSNGANAHIRFYAGNASAAQSNEVGRFVSTNGNLILQNGGTFTDGGQRLQVQGTTLLNGNVTFSSATGMFWDATNSRLGIGTNAPAVNVHVVYSDNTYLNGFYVQNTNTGSQAYTGIGLQDASGTVVAGFQYVPNTFTNVSLRNTVLFASTGLSKLGFVANSGGVSSTAQDIYFQTLSAKFNMYLYGATGNLVLQNGGTFLDSGERLQVTGTAKITSKLSMGAGTTSAAQINLASSTAPTSPANGDIWFDGTDIKMRIGGVTKTFTLV